jgi:hypothetical protein
VNIGVHEFVCRIAYIWHDIFFFALPGDVVFAQACKVDWRARRGWRGLLKVLAIAMQDAIKRFRTGGSSESGADRTLLWSGAFDTQRVEAPASHVPDLTDVGLIETFEIGIVFRAKNRGRWWASPFGIAAGAVLVLRREGRGHVGVGGAQKAAGADRSGTPKVHKSSERD